MSNTIEVDTAPEAVDVENVVSTETPTEMNQEALAAMFAREETSNVQDEETSASDSKVEEPASDTDLTSQPEEEEESFTIKDETDSKEIEAKSGTPDWVQPRLDKLTAQRKAAEERAEALEAKLVEKASQESASSLDHMTSISQLDELERQAIQAEDEVEDLLETDPEYAENDYDNENPYWLVGDEKMSREQLINIKKNARKAFRAVPAKRKFLEEKTNVDANLEKISFFSDPKDPWYGKAQELLSSQVYTDMEIKIPDAKVLAYLIIKGLQVEEVERGNKPSQQTVKPTQIIKSTPASKAAIDTATSPNPLSDSDNIRKRNKIILSSGNVSSEEAALLFR